MDYNKDVIIFDLETPKKCFLASFYIVEKKEYIDFLINSDRNDLFKLTKFLSDNKNKYFVGYNNINFDNQIIEEINRNIDYLSSLSNLELSEYICNYASSLIELSNHNSRLPYSEENFSFKVIDLPRIWHFFNENRRTSLKVLEYEMRAETIETFEFDINQDFKEEDIEKLIYYCHNDIKYTYEHFKYTVGDTNHILYRGEDKIQDRLDIIEETGYKCLNWDDVKIGSESNKSEYLRITQRDEKDLKPKRINFAYGKCFKEFFPKTVKFNTPNLKKFINELGNERIKKNIKNKKQEFKFRFNNELVSTIAKGGIHSNDKPRFIKPEEDEIYLQIDIGGQYPNAMVKYKAFPKHLGLPWNKVIESNIIKRDFHKKEYKLTKNRKHNSIQKMLKLSNNGGSYGKLSSKGDWQEDPCTMYQITIGCQLEILMVTERLLENKFRVLSQNTDGLDLIFKRDRLDQFFNLMNELEIEIGNDKIGNFEYTEFEWFAQLTVNDYLAKKKGEWINRVFYPHKSKDEGDHLKAKGDMEYWKELNKNSSFSIIPLTLQNYFDKGIDYAEFIENHNDIFDFCARSNAGWDFDHVEFSNNSNKKLPKLVRYYVGKKGVNVMKVVKENCLTNANDTNIRPATKLKTVCNTLIKSTWKEHLDNVDRQWYIDEVELMIKSILSSKKKTEIKIVPKIQLKIDF